MTGILAQVAIWLLIIFVLLAGIAWILRIAWRDYRRIQAAEQAIRFTRRPVNHITVTAKGDSIDALKDAALIRARAFYGGNPHVVVERVSDVRSLLSGAFAATVEVRNYGTLPPAVVQPGHRQDAGSQA